MFYTAWNCGMWTVIVVFWGTFQHGTVLCLRFRHGLCLVQLPQTIPQILSMPYITLNRATSPHYAQPQSLKVAHTHTHALQHTFISLSYKLLCPFWIVSGILHIWACIFCFVCSQSFVCRLLVWSGNIVFILESVLKLQRNSVCPRKRSVLAEHDRNMVVCRYHAV